MTRALAPTAASVVLLCGSSLLGGCGGEQFGGSTDGHDPPSCVAVEERELDFDDSSPLGFSPREVMEFAAGRHKSAMLWGPPNNQSDRVSLEPASKMTQILVDVEQEGARYTFVDLELEEASTWATSEGVHCADELHIETEVAIRSENGAFDEAMSTILIANQSWLVSGKLDLIDSSTTTRSVEIHAEEEVKILDVPFSFHIVQGGGLSGNALVSYELRTSSAVSLPPPIVLARFPDEDPCSEDSRVHLPAESPPIESLRKALEKLEGVSVTWAEKEGVDELESSLITELFCVRSPLMSTGRPGRLDFELQMKPSDTSGSAWRLQGWAESDSTGGLRGVTVAIEDPSMIVSSASKFERDYGLSLPDNLADDDEVQLLLELSWDETWQGTIELLARSLDDPCAPDNLPEVPVPETGGPIPEECIVDNVYHAGWKAIDQGEMRFE